MTINSNLNGTLVLQVIKESFIFAKVIALKWCGNNINWIN